jgi:N-methylhydantoinase A/oxoprolinase/acetone carboxylase beta subunit
MARTSEAPYVDMQVINDDMADVYEAIATIEYSGRDPSHAQIAEATRLPDQVVDESLAAMTQLGMLTADDASEERERVYRPARRGWSAQPDQAQGQKLS